MHLFLKLFILVKHSTCFGQSFRPSSGVQDCIYRNRYMSNRYCCLLASKQTTVSVWHCLLLYIQFWTPDDGRKDRPKHVQCFRRTNNLKNKCVVLVLLSYSFIFFRFYFYQYGFFLVWSCNLCIFMYFYWLCILIICLCL